MHLDAIWRYPVKSMAGEQLSRAELGASGVAGDRRVQVRDRFGRIVTSRSHPALLAHQGSQAEDGTVRVDGRAWNSEGVAADVRRIVGPMGWLSLDEGLERFDVLPLLVITDGALKAFGRDVRRLRPNLVIAGVEGLAERDWPGRLLRIGSSVVRLDSRRERCVMTTYDPDTQVRDIEVLRDIRARFGGELALNAEVLEPGSIAVGDHVELLDGLGDGIGR